MSDEDSTDHLMVTLFVSDFRVLKEDPPPDAIEVQVVSMEEDAGAKDILAMYQKVEGEMVRATVFAKFWSGPEDRK